MLSTYPGVRRTAIVAGCYCSLLVTSLVARGQASGQVVGSLSDAEGSPGESVAVTARLSEAGGIASFDAVIEYDHSALDAQDLAFSDALSGFVNAENLGVPGRITVGGFATGDGLAAGRVDLFSITFLVLEGAPSETAVVFASLTLNDEGNAPVASSTVDALVTGPNGNSGPPPVGDTVTGTLSDASGAPGADVVVTASLSDADAIASFDATIEYDSSALEAQVLSFSDSLAEFVTAHNLQVPGRITVGGFATGAGLPAGAGDLFSITFTVIEAAPAETAIVFASLALNDEQNASVATNTVDGTIAVDGLSYTVSLHQGVNALHVPLKVPTLRRLSDLYTHIGGPAKVSVMVALNDDGDFDAFTADAPVGSHVDLPLKDHTGVIAVMTTANQVTFTGMPLSPSVPLDPGLNVIGVPRAGDPVSLSEIAARSPHIRVVVREENGRFTAYPPYDFNIEGGRAYIIPAMQAVTLQFPGDPWTNAPLSAPSAVADGPSSHTPILVVSGRVRPHSLADTARVVVTYGPTGATAETVVNLDGNEGRFSTVLGDLLGEGFTAGAWVDIRLVDAVTGNSTTLRHTLSREDVRASLVDVGAIAAEQAPRETSLMGNYPNPFNPETWIPFTLSGEASVTVSIYDMRGRLVRAVNLGGLPEGAYTTRATAAYWDGRNDQGEPVSSGVYYYRLDAGEFSASRPMMLLK